MQTPEEVDNDFVDAEDFELESSDKGDDDEDEDVIIDQEGEEPEQEDLEGEETVEEDRDITSPDNAAFTELVTGDPRATAKANYPGDAGDSLEGFDRQTMKTGGTSSRTASKKVAKKKATKKSTKKKSTKKSTKRSKKK